MMVQGTGRMDAVMPKPVASSKTVPSSPEESSSFADRLEKVTTAPVTEKVEDGKPDQEETKSAQVEKILDSILQIVEKDGLPMKLEDNPELQALMQQLYALMNAHPSEMKNGVMSSVEKSEASLLALNASPEEWMKKMYDLLVTVQKTLGGNADKPVPQGLQEKFQQVFDLLKGTDVLRNIVGTKPVNVETGKPQAEGLQAVVTQPVKPEQGTASQQQFGTGQGKSDQSAASEEIEPVTLGDGETVKVVHHQLTGATPVASKEATSAGKAHIPLVPSRFFVNEMEGFILKQVQLNRGTGAMETVIRLFPENLGRVDVRISALNGNIMAQFITTNAAGKEAVEQHLNQLRQALAQHGLHVEKLEVTQLQTSQNSSSTNQDTLDGQGKGQSQQQQAREEETQQSEGNFLDFLLGEQEEVTDEQQA